MQAPEENLGVGEVSEVRVSSVKDAGISFHVLKKRVAASGATPLQGMMELVTRQALTTKEDPP